MKKFGLLTIILSMIISITNAQDAGTKKFRFGLQGMPAISWMKPDAKNVSNNGVKLNASYGALIDYKFANNFSFVSGFNVCYTGGKMKSTFDSLTQDVTVAGKETSMTFKSLSSSNEYKLQYLEIPVMLKMTTKEIGYFTYFANIGLGIGCNLKAKGNYTYTYNNGSDEPLLRKDNEDIKDDISFFRPSFIIGGGAEYSLGGSTALLVSANFNNGLTNILKNDEGKTINNFVSLNVAILF